MQRAGRSSQKAVEEGASREEGIRGDETGTSGLSSPRAIFDKTSRLSEPRFPRF